MMIVSRPPASIRCQPHTMARGRLALRRAASWGRLWFLALLLPRCWTAAGLLSRPKFSSSYEVDNKLEDHGMPIQVQLLTRHRRQATTVPENETIIDNHIYYTSSYFRARPGESVLWVDLDDPGISDQVQAPANLATGVRQGKNVRLKFEFPFYGHSLDSVVITTGGFLYTGSYIHRHLVATQYIAPLMGNFSPSLSQPAGVRYYDNGTALTVEWKEQLLADNMPAGIFTFQATLFDDGRIVFAYKQIPITVSSISDADHPVKIGLADAYYIDQMISLFTKKREIYEYHKVEINKSLVVSGSLVLFSPLPTCNQLDSCSACTSSDVDFNCTWCVAVERCSDGLDRKRQSWLDSHCDSAENYINSITQCPGYTPPPPTEATPTTKAPPSTSQPANVKGPSTAQVIGTSKPNSDQTPASTVDYCQGVKCLNGGICEVGLCNCPRLFDGARCQKYVTFHCQGIVCKNGGTCREGITTHICDCRVGFSGKYCDVVVDLPVKSQSSSSQGLTVGAIVSIVLISLLIFGLFGWAVYAYRHPTSPSGLFVLEAKHRLKGRGRGSNGVKYKYHQQMDNNQVDIQL